MTFVKTLIILFLAWVCVACSSSGGGEALPTVAMLPTIANTIPPTPILTLTNTLTITPTMTPSATITNTPIPSVTLTSTITYTPIPTITPTRPSPQELSISLEIAMGNVQGVASIDSISVIPSSSSNDTVYAEITVLQGFNHPGTADMLRQITYATLLSAFVDFSVILADGQTAPIDYVWDNSTGTWQTTVLTSLAPIQPTTPPVSTVPVQSRYTCNCSKTCPNMSSCEEAYYQLNTCGCNRRDGDNDGVPCESICPGG